MLSELSDQKVKLPRVSVILSTYKGEQFLAETIESILKQSFRDFELIVVNDNPIDSTHSTLEILASFTDDRLKIIDNKNNIGYAASLNKGIKVARGEYITIQEHDDVSLPTRIERQVQYLDAHADVAFVSSSAFVIDEHGDFKGLRQEHCEDIDLKWSILWGQPVLHSIIMFRGEVIRQVEGYSEAPDHLYSPDYEIVSRIVRKYKVANISEPLFKWRRHPQTLSNVNLSSQDKQGTVLAQKNIQAVVGPNCLTSDVWQRLNSFLLTLPTDEVSLSAQDLELTISFLQHLQDSFYRLYSFRAVEIAKHRRKLYLKWGKHCLSLAYRRNGVRNLHCRLVSLILALKLLGKMCLDWNSVEL
jgi:glycosyltransferase involved in cell wall biosynthesis